jgi:hypothetical protein
MFCPSRFNVPIPFVLITIQTAPGVGVHASSQARPTLSRSLVTLLPHPLTHLLPFQSLARSSQEHRGCAVCASRTPLRGTQERNPPSTCKPTQPRRTNPRFMAPLLKTSFPLHPPSHGGTISPGEETFPFYPVSNTTERTTGSPARVIQHSARDRRPGPLAIRERHPASSFPHRSGKASSVRLGERSFVGR